MKVKKLPKELFENAIPSNMTMEEALSDVICPFDEVDLIKAKKRYERKKRLKDFFQFKKSN